MKNLFCLIGQLGNGGTERQLFLFLKNLDRTKYNPMVVVSGIPDGIWHDRIKELDINIIALGNANPVLKLLKFRYLVFRYKIDIIFSWSFFTNAFHMVRGNAQFIGSLRQQLNYCRTELKPSHFNACLKPDVMVVNSTYMLNELVNEGCPKEKVHVVYNIFENFDSKNTTDKQQLRKNLNLPEDKLIIIGVGRNSPSKNFPFFVDVMEKVLPAFPQCHAVIVGSGGPAVQAKIEEKGLVSSFTLTGEVPDASTYIKAADIFFLSSISEGFANVLIEAFDAQCACIATDVGGVTDLIDDGENGYIIESNNLANAVDKFNSLLTTPDQIKQFSEKTGTKLQLFTVEESMKRYYQALE